MCCVCGCSCRQHHLSAHVSIPSVSSLPKRPSYSLCESTLRFCIRSFFVGGVTPRELTYVGQSSFSIEQCIPIVRILVRKYRCYSYRKIEASLGLTFVICRLVPSHLDLFSTNYLRFFLYTRQYFFRIVSNNQRWRPAMAENCG